jgi:flagellar biosynthesis/type III secretory pathway chaperone
MTIEQAVGALCTHLEAERASLEQLYYLLEHELQALREMNRERIHELNQYKLQILQSHQELQGARAYYLAPFTPPTGERPTLTYICYHLPPELRAYVQPYQEALKSLALAIKSSQSRNQEFARTAQQVIRTTRKQIEEASPEQRQRTYTAKGKMTIQVPRGRGYGKG